MLNWKLEKALEIFRVAKRSDGLNSVVWNKTSQKNFMVQQPSEMANNNFEKQESYCIYFLALLYKKDRDELERVLLKGIWMAQRLELHIRVGLDDQLKIFPDTIILLL